MKNSISRLDVLFLFQDGQKTRVAINTKNVEQLHPAVIDPSVPGI